MPALPKNVAVDCPRCGQPVDCTLATTEVRDDDRRGYVILECSIPDLAQRLADHYRTAH